MIERRKFIIGVTSLLASPISAEAQRRARPVIGFLGAGTAPSWKLWTDTFNRRLNELGWGDGSNIEIDYRWGDGVPQRYTDFARQLVDRKVDLIVTGGAAVPAAQGATTSIPIVFAVANDPVGAGYVKSLSRPGGNVTGLALQSSDLVGKRLELLREIAPNARRLALLVNTGNRGAILDLEEASILAPKLGFAPAPLRITRAEEIWRAFETIGHNSDAIYLCRDALLNAHEVKIAELALTARLPAIFLNREVVIGAGGLVSYGPYLPDLFRRAAEIVDKVLRGTKPADIPVEQPTRFELAINLKTARALGLEVPPMLLARADEVIE